MQTNEFLRFLADSRMPVFSLNDAAKILNKPRSYVRLFLHRCTARNLIGRAERGLYYLREGSNEYEIASSVVSPSYVSMISALYYYGLTTQIPRVVYVVSPKRHRTLRDVLGYGVVFKKIKKELMFGYRKEAGGNISVAEPEKAVVDIYYFNDVNDLDETALDKPQRLNVSKLAEYAGRSGKKAVIAGIAELLGSHGYKREATDLLRLRTDRRHK